MSTPYLGLPKCYFCPNMPFIVFNWIHQAKYVDWFAQSRSTHHTTSSMQPQLKFLVGWSHCDQYCWKLNTYPPPAASGGGVAIPILTQQNMCTEKIQPAWFLWERAPHAGQNVLQKKVNNKLHTPIWAKGKQLNVRLRSSQEQLLWKCWQVLDNTCTQFSVFNLFSLVLVLWK